MLLIDSESGRILDANNAAEQFYGYTLAQFKDMLITKINTLSPDRVAEERARALREERNYFIFPHKLSNGETRTVEVYSSPVLLEGKTVLFSIIHDITTHKIAEAALLETEAAQRQSAEQYQSLFERMMDGIYRSTHAGKFVNVNPAMVKMFGYDNEEEMRSIDIKKDLYFAPEERGSHILDTGQEETEVYRMRRKDGSEIWVEDHGWYVHDESGKIIFHEGILRDVTERKRAQSLWTKYTEQIHMLYQASRQLNASIDKQHIYEVTYNCISQIAPCDSMYISSFERHTNMITLASCWQNGAQMDTGKFAPALLDSKGMDIESEAIRTGTAMFLNNYPERVKNANAIYSENTAIPNSGLIVPMSVENQVIGTILIFSYKPNAYAESDLNVVNTLASQTAVALINSDLFQRVQQENRERKQAETLLRARTRELETLFSISNHISLVQTETEILPQILKELERAIEADTIAIILLEPKQDYLSISSASGELAPYIGFKFRIDEGINGAVLGSRQIYQTKDLSSDPMRIKNMQGIDHLGAAVFTPILSGDNLIGVMLAARKKEHHLAAFTLEATRLMITTSELFGNALNRVRLRAETLRRLDHLQTLRAVDQAIASSLDLHITLNILLKHTITQLEVDSAVIFLLHPHQQTLQYAASQGFRNHHIEHAEIRLNDEFAGRCVMERVIIEIHDPEQVSHNLPFARLWAEENFASYLCVPLVAKGEVKGVLEVYRRTLFTPDDEWLEFLDTLASQAAITVDNAQMFNNLQSANMELAIAYDATIEGWSHAMDLRDKETEGHTQRVTEITLQLAKVMAVSDKEMLHIRRGALLHDIGKMGIPDRILLKQGKLTPKEWKIMRMHPVFAFDMLQPIRYLRQSLDIPYAHHERWDGSGYPRGLKGEAIPLTVRIFSVVDVFDALTSERSYRKAWTKRKTLAYIKERRGTEFDPQVVDAFLKMMR